MLHRLRKEAKAWAISGLLVLAVALTFGRSLGCAFVNLDDGDYVYSNPQVSRGLSADGVAWAFTTCHSSNWHPVTWLSHMLDCQLYGLRPAGHHLTNLLVHALNAVLLFWIFYRMTGDLWPSAFTAALFALHPLRVESVAWIAERKDVLSGLFFLLTLAAYLGYVRSPFSWTRYLTVVALFALGLMAKPMLVTLPFLLLLLDYWPLCRFQPACGLGWRAVARLLVEKLPLLALSIASCAATMIAQRGAIAIGDIVPMPTRIVNAITSYVSYVGDFFYPSNLSVFYPHAGDNRSPEVVAACALGLAAVSIAAVVLRRRFPYGFVGWFWYLGMLVPVIGVVQVGLQAMADRYTYLPQIGLGVAIAWGVAPLVTVTSRRRVAVTVVAAVLVALLAICSFRQISYWRNSESMWRRNAACTSRNELAFYMLGNTLVGLRQLDEAIVAYHEALRITPDSERVLNNLGFALVHSVAKVTKPLCNIASPSKSIRTPYSPTQTSPRNSVAKAEPAKPSSTGERSSAWSQTISSPWDNWLGRWPPAPTRRSATAPNHSPSPNTPSNSRNVANRPYSARSPPPMPR